MAFADEVLKSTHGLRAILLTPVRGWRKNRVRHWPTYWLHDADPR